MMDDLLTGSSIEHTPSAGVTSRTNLLDSNKVPTLFGRGTFDLRERTMVNL